MLSSNVRKKLGKTTVITSILQPVIIQVEVCISSLISLDI